MFESVGHCEPRRLEHDVEWRALHGEGVSQQDDRVVLLTRHKAPLRTGLSSDNAGIEVGQVRLVFRLAGHKPCGRLNMGNRGRKNREAPPGWELPALRRVMINTWAASRL